MKSRLHITARWAFAGLLAVGICAVVFNQKEVGRVKSEQVSLTSDSQEAHRLAEENNGINALRESNAEWEKLREQNKDLPALRNEVRQLRRQAEELTKLRAENEQLAAGIKSAGNGGGGGLPAGFISRAALRDVGAGSPEAMAQTLFWAFSHGNLERLAQLQVDPGPQAVGPDREQERSNLVQEAQGFPGFAIASTNIISPDEIEIGLQTSVGGTIAPMKLKRVGNEWKLNEH